MSKQTTTTDPTMSCRICGAHDLAITVNLADGTEACEACGSRVHELIQVSGIIPTVPARVLAVKVHQAVVALTKKPAALQGGAR